MRSTWKQECNDEQGAFVSTTSGHSGNLLSKKRILGARSIRLTKKGFQASPSLRIIESQTINTQIPFKLDSLGHLICINRLRDVSYYYSIDLLFICR
jgi:hypothetical protein